MSSSGTRYRGTNQMMATQEYPPLASWGLPPSITLKEAMTGYKTGARPAGGEAIYCFRGELLFRPAQHVVLSRQPLDRCLGLERCPIAAKSSG
jgi:hypothetical protein